MKVKALLFAFLFVLTLPAWQAVAGGARVTVRSGHAGISRSSGGFVHHRHSHSGFRHHGHHGLNATIGRHPHHQHFRHHQHLGHHRQFHRGFGHHKHSHHIHFGRHGHLHHGFGHHHSFIAPHHHFGFHGGVTTVVIGSPFFCLPHGVEFVNQAGFLDHLHGYHGIPIENALSFCTEGDSSCIFGSQQE
jgi:hypothetical protein